MATLVNAAAATEVTANSPGIYFYTYSGSLDFTTYFYLAAFKTTDTTVQATQQAAAFFDYPLSISKTAAGKVSEVVLTDVLSGYTVPPSPSAIATALWTDANAADFTAPGSIGKSLFTGGQAPGASGGLVIAGSNAPVTFAAFTVTGAFAGTLSAVTNLTNLPAIPASWLTAAGIAPDAGAEIAGAVWDLQTAGHTTAGSFGAAVSAGGGDPLLSPVPDDYPPGTAGWALGRVSTGPITFVSPVPVVGGQVLTLVKGDDYMHVDGRSIPWTDPTGASWPDLTGATVAFLAPGIVQAGVIVQATGPAKQVRVDIPRTATATALHLVTYNLVSTLPNGDIWTLARGLLTIN